MSEPFAAPEPIDFHRRRDAGSVLSDSIAFLREHVVDLGKGFLYIVGPVLVAIIVVQAFTQDQATAFEQMFNPSSDPEAFASMFGPAYFVSIGLVLIASTLVYAVGFAYVFLYLEGAPGPITVPELWGRTKQLLAKVFLTTVGLSFLLIVSMIILLVPCLGALAWLAGWVYLFPAVFLLLPARLIDEGDFFSALRRARHLVEGYWGQTFGVVVLVGVVIMVMALVVTLPAMIVGAVIGFHGAAEVGPLARGLLTLGTVLGSLAYFAYILFPVAATMHYYNLVTKQEGSAGLGLEDQIEAIAQDADTPDDARESAAWDETDWSGRADPGDAEPGDADRDEEADADRWR